ncbi:MAG: hypothetical protein GXY76_22675 [Chloroflexi bacterium]|nr:hypothetical protein [Chloroflexota bacterium]
MKVALLADVHGNAPALRAVLRDCGERQVDEHWFLGDLLGYGPQPVSCYRLLAEKRPAVWLLGNHDFVGLGILRSDLANLDHIVARGLVPGRAELDILGWHARQLEVGLEPGEIHALHAHDTWVNAIPGIYAAHGALLSSEAASADNISGANSYLRLGSSGPQITAQVLAALHLDEEERPWLVVAGHVHEAAICQIRWAPPQQPEWKGLTWDDGSAYGDPPPACLGLAGCLSLLCPGSVGGRLNDLLTHQPTYAILDTDNRTVQYRRVAYDVRETLAAMVLPPRAPNLESDLTDLMEDWKTRRQMA